MKPNQSVKAAKRHESDAHGPRMKCSECKFSCPEGRPSEMKVHLVKKHNLPTGSPPFKRRRTSPSVTQIPATVAPPTVRVAPEKPVVESYTLAPNQENFFSQLGGLDLGPEPDVDIGEPASYIPSFGPVGVSDFTSLELSCLSYDQTSVEVPIPKPASPSPAVVHKPGSFISVSDYDPYLASISGSQSVSIPSSSYESDSRSISEPLPVSVPLPVSEPLPVTVSDPLSVTVYEYLPVTVSDPLPVTVSDPLPVTVPDPLPVSDTLSVSEPLPVSVSDPLPVSEPLPVSDPLPVSVSDTLPVSEPLPVSDPLPVSVFDTLSVSEPLPVSVSDPLPVSELLPVSEPLPVSDPLPVSVSDSVAVSARTPALPSLGCAPLPSTVVVSYSRTGSVSCATTGSSTSVTFTGLTGRSTASVTSTITQPNLLSLPASLSLLQVHNTPLALPAGMADMITYFYHLVRP